ncbi:MAG: S-methyl-5'-thioadenosine phosphorylase [Actinobacteria bacterium]|nr:S-methyl-5'-thioadenosine phosphorylase [Actinomycetota bacterium]
MTAAALPEARVGVFGGSGFYSFLESEGSSNETGAVEFVDVDTPFGPPSAPIALGRVAGVAVAFLPRHGVSHEFPPHVVNWRANLWAMQEMGVTRLLGPCAAGSLKPSIHPGDFVVLDQLVDRTSGRVQTYYDGPVPHHVAFADPYCPELAGLAVDAARARGVNSHDRGTVVVVQGPRFSTRAESAWFRSQGWDVVNMTQYPEAYLARELGICYSGIALVTDYDTGLEGEPGIEPVTMEAVFGFLEANVEAVRSVLFDLIPRIPEERTSCACSDARGPLPDHGGSLT